MSTATSGNFIEGGTVDPFGLQGGKPLTLQEQAELEERKRQERLRSQANQTSSINARPGGFNEQRREEGQINPKTGRPWTPEELAAENTRWERIKAHNRTEADKNFFERSHDFIADNPWVLGMPAAPLIGAAAFPAAAGTGSIAGGGGAAIAGGTTAAAAPAITTGGAVTEAAIAAPVATGATTATTAAAPAAASAFTAGEALKDVAPVLAAVAPMAIDAFAGGRTKEEKALLAKQAQMAKEAEARRFQVQESRMNALGQQLLAFNPRNQMMAQMFGPEAAFQPEALAAMSQNPMPPPEMPPELIGAHMGPTNRAKMAEYERRKQQYEEGNRARHDQAMAGFAPPGPGPAPLQQRTPQAARKY